jgi:FkbM family methyltransferase
VAPPNSASASALAARLLEQVRDGRGLDPPVLAELLAGELELDLPALGGHLAAFVRTPEQLLELLARPEALAEIARERRELVAELFAHARDDRPLTSKLRHAFGVLSQLHEQALRRAILDGRLDPDTAAAAAFDRGALRRCLAGETAPVELVFDTTCGHADQQHVATTGACFDEPLAIDERGDLRVHVSNAVELWRAATTATLESATFEWLADTIDEHSVVWDVGANMGVIALAAWREGAAQVVAFEPEPLNYARLVENIALNDARTILALPLALSDQAGLTHFAHRDFVRGAASPHAIDTPDDDPRPRVACLRQRLDALVDDPMLRPPTHLKIDVDGHELQVLAGATRTLASSTLTHILIELQRANLAATFALLAEAGFRHVGGQPHGEGVGNYRFERW